MQHLEGFLYTDGGSRGNPGPSGAGVRLLDTNQQVIIEKSFFLGRTTNNAAEYTALIYGLELALQHKITRLNIFTDSLLIVNHVTGIYKIRNSRLKPLYDKVINLLKYFGDGYVITHIPREKNKKADTLANEAMNRGY